MSSDPNLPKNSSSADDDFSSSEPLSLPHDLPEVQPPSAGMIVQLFLVPALIVAVIVGVYALFGAMASQELNWRDLVVNVQSENAHVRWRGALGLAQMLDLDVRRGEEGQQLSKNQEIAEALSSLYDKLTVKRSPTEDELKQIEFLSKALGRMDVEGVVIPALRRGSESDRDPGIRKHSLIGLAMAIGTMKDAGSYQTTEDLLAEVIAISQEPDLLFRRQAAYILGLDGSAKALERLRVLLADPDQMVRANSAVGFARNNQLQGVPVFEEVLEEAAGWDLNPQHVKTQEEESRYFEQTLLLSNTLRAIDQLAPVLQDAQRTALLKQMQALSEQTHAAVIRSELLALIQKLQQS